MAITYLDNIPVRFQTSDYIKYNEGVCYDFAKFMPIWGQPIQISDIISFQVGIEENGSNLTTNPGFATNSDWTFGTDWAHDTDKATYTYSGGGGGNLSQAIGIAAGSIYKVTYDIKAISTVGSNVFSVKLGAITIDTITSSSTTGVQTIYYYSILASTDILSIEHTTTDAGNLVTLSIDDFECYRMDTPGIALKDDDGTYVDTNKSVTLVDGVDVAQIDYTVPNKTEGNYQLCIFNSGSSANNGAEKITDGGFVSSGNWTETGGCLVIGGKATFSGGGTLQNSNTLTLIDNNTYKISVTFENPYGTGNIAITLGGTAVATLAVTSLTHGQNWSGVIKIGTVSSQKINFTVDATASVDLDTLSVVAIIGDDATEDKCTEPYHLKSTHSCSKLLAWTNASNAYGVNYEDFTITLKMRIIGEFGMPNYPEEDNVQYLDSSTDRLVRYVSDYKTEELELFPQLGAPSYIHDALKKGFNHGTFAIDGVNYVRLPGDYTLEKIIPNIKLYKSTINLQKSTGSGDVISPATGQLSSSGISDAYAFMTDGSNTSGASGSDTFKFRTANNLLSIAVTSNDATHGDNLLLTINQANISITESQISDLGTYLSNGDHWTLTGDPYLYYNGGNVGIGTATPAYNFHIYRNAGIYTAAMQIQNIASSGSAAILYTVDVNNYVVGVNNGNNYVIASGDNITTSANRIAVFDSDGIYVPYGHVTIGNGFPSANADLTLKDTGAISLLETTTPTAEANYGKVYTKSDNALYFQDGAGTEHTIDLDGAGGGGNTIYSANDTLTAAREIATGGYTLTLNDNSATTTPYFIIEQDSTGDAGMRLSLSTSGVYYDLIIDNSDSDAFKLKAGASDVISVSSSGTTTLERSVKFGGGVSGYSFYTTDNYNSTMGKWYIDGTGLYSASFSNALLWLAGSVVNAANVSIYKSAIHIDFDGNASDNSGSYIQGIRLTSGVASGSSQFSAIRIESSNWAYGIYQVESAVDNYFNGDTGFGDNSPTAKVDINSDILRLRTSKTPSSASDTGNQGDICWDSNYIYVCTASNTWKRAALSTW